MASQDPSHTTPDSVPTGPESVATAVPEAGGAAEPFDQGAGDGVPGEDELILDLEGYEGPLDALLALARDQKVDLRRISMLALSTSISTSSPGRGACGSRSPPTIS